MSLLVVLPTYTGTRRRIAVCDYELTDPLEPEFAKEVSQSAN